MEKSPYKLEQGRIYIVINGYPYPVKKSAIPELMECNAPLFKYIDDSIQPIDIVKQEGEE